MLFLVIATRLAVLEKKNVVSDDARRRVAQSSPWLGQGKIE
jgi:hypothetical protein